jgi:hypothetical protein
MIFWINEHQFNEKDYDGYDDDKIKEKEEEELYDISDQIVKH